MRPDGFVLAGGRSIRMGTDKARLVLDGVPMALRIAGLLSRCCDRVALVRHEADAWRDGEGRRLEVVEDPPESGDDRHPLWGVAAALSAAATPLVVVVSCDVPHLTEEALHALIEAADLERGAIADDGERVHPLVAVLPAGWAGRALQEARSGGSVRGFTSACHRVRLPAEVLRNVNRPEDAPGDA